MSETADIATWKGIAFALVKAILFLTMALFLLAGPLIASTTSFYDQGERSTNAFIAALVALLTIFLPSLAIDAALVGLFPSWRFLHVALPVVAALTLIVWAWLNWQVYLGDFAKYPNVVVRWHLLVATPVGIVAANAFMFLLARGRRPAVSRS